MDRGGPLFDSLVPRCDVVLLSGSRVVALCRNNRVPLCAVVRSNAFHGCRCPSDPVAAGTPSGNRRFLVDTALMVQIDLALSLHRLITLAFPLCYGCHLR